MLRRARADPFCAGARDGGAHRTRGGETLAAVVPVLIASGSPALAQGLADFLGDPPLAPMVVHGCEGARACVLACHPRAAIVDRTLVDGPGRVLAAELATWTPAIPVLAVAYGPSPDDGPEAMPSDVAGVVSVFWSRDAVVDAVVGAMQVAHSVDAATARVLAAGGAGAAVELTEQERVVLRLMRQHLTYKEIALQMGLSWHTVRTHAQSVLRKTGVHSRRDLRFVDGGVGGAASIPAT